ncbi:MAG TPA: c-type cytochrome domain-containing protein [Kofleriaceae bacterium]
MIRACALALLLAGCLDRLGPQVGAEQFSSCVDPNASGDDGDSLLPDTPISFERDIRIGIFNRSDVHCVKCHTPGGATPVGLHMGGLDLSTYATLMAGGFHSMGTAIIPGMPCESILIEKISPAPPFGARMPKDGPPYLSDTDAETIIQWIAEGARDN